MSLLTFAALSVVALILAGIVLAVIPVEALRVEVLRSAGSLPPHIVGAFEEPLGFQQSASGIYFVFDRRGHAVYTIDLDKRGVRKAVEIGVDLVGRHRNGGRNEREAFAADVKNTRRTGGADQPGKLVGRDGVWSRHAGALFG